MPAPVQSCVGRIFCVFSFSIRIGYAYLELARTSRLDCFSLDAGVLVFPIFNS